MNRPKYCLVVYSTINGYDIDKVRPVYAMSFRSKAGAIEACNLYTEPHETGIVYKDGAEIYRNDTTARECKYYDKQYKACFATKCAERLGCEGKKERCRL